MKSWPLVEPAALQAPMRSVTPPTVGNYYGACVPDCTNSCDIKPLRGWHENRLMSTNSVYAGEGTMMNKALAVSVVCAGFLAVNGPANALLTFIGSDDAGARDPRPNADAAQAEFMAAIGSFELIDFEDLTPTADDELVVTLAPGVTATWTDVAVVNGGMIRNFGSKAVGYNTTPGGRIRAHIDPDDPDTIDARMTIDFDTEITSWGAYITGIDPTIGDVRILFNDGTSQSFDLGGFDDGGVTFFGFTDVATPITQVVIASQNGSDSIGIDDIMYKPVPEPATLALVGAGLAGMGVAARRRRKS